MSILGISCTPAGRPLASSVVYKALLHAEELGEFRLSKASAFNRCNDFAPTTKDAFDYDISTLLAEARIVREKEFLCRTPTWEAETLLHKELSAVSKRNNLSPPMFLDSPLRSAGDIPADHPLFASLMDAAKTHLTHKLSIALLDSVSEIELLLMAIARERIGPFCLQTNVVCASTHQGAMALESLLKKPVYILPQVLNGQTRLKIIGPRHEQTSTRVTTIVPMGPDFFLSPGLLHRLLLDQQYGKNVVLAATKDFLALPAGRLLCNLVDHGFPTTSFH